MKPFFQCACLFFALFPNPQTVAEQSRFYTQQVQQYTQKEKSSWSAMKYLAQKKEANLRSIQEANQTIELGKIDLICQQQGKSTQYTNEKTIKSAFYIRNKNDKHNQKIEKVSAKIQNEYEEACRQKEVFQQKQKELFETNPALSGFRSDGSYSKEALLSGMQDLPSIGGMYEDEVDLACVGFDSFNTIPSSSSFLAPYENAIVSAGTWSYPQGGLHLGMDFAVDLYSPLQAPFAGLILYANAPVPSDNGYLGNYCGWPAGGGNTICMIGIVDGKGYLMSFAHLSNTIYVRAGQSVNQGDLLALSGNSGNSTGPHTHIEVFSLSKDIEEVISYFKDTADFSLMNGWDEANTCSEYACRIQPETIF